MRCRYCQSEIEEFIKWDFQNERQVKRYECPCCGPLDYRTLLPIKVEASI